MSRIVVICSEFNKELVENLYNQAYKEFHEYQKTVKQLLLGESTGALFSSYKFFKNLTPSELERNKDKKHFIEKMSSWELEQIWVPGAGEIPLAVKWAIEKQKAQAVLALGVIIKGQTSHYNFLCGLLQQALWDLQKTYSWPIIFSVLMTKNREQAEERIQKKRGAEGMQSLIKMIELNYGP